MKYIEMLDAFYLCVALIAATIYGIMFCPPTHKTFNYVVLIIAILLFLTIGVKINISWR